MMVVLLTALGMVCAVWDTPRSGAATDSPSDAGPEVTIHVSVANDGARGRDGYSRAPSISANGRFVAFESEASNLVLDDTNRALDVFVRDLASGTTSRVSVSSREVEGNRGSGEGATSISGQGRYVAFASRASNLVRRDTNRSLDVFVRDRVKGTTRRVSVSSSGRQSNDGSQNPAISADGRFVAFVSWASNLVPGDTNNSIDVFVRNLVTGTTTRPSVSSREIQGNHNSFSPAISAHGRYVAFPSVASNLIRRDTNRNFDVFVRDRAAGTTRRVSVSTKEAEGRGFSGNDTAPAISPGGRYIAFASLARNLVPGDTNRDSDVFVRDRAAGTTRRVSIDSEEAQGFGYSYAPSISGQNGRYVAFASTAALVTDEGNGGYDVFVRDRMNGTTHAVSVSTTGAVSGSSDSPAISRSGGKVAFTSTASDLTAGDTDDVEDVFLRGAP
jgi:Tol biopolymer transport system component